MEWGYGSFIMAIVVFQVVPGAGTIAILNATARRGVGFGMSAVLGTLAGDFIYMLAVYQSGPVLVGNAAARRFSHWKYARSPLVWLGRR